MNFLIHISSFQSFLLFIFKLSLAFRSHYNNTFDIQSKMQALKCLIKDGGLDCFVKTSPWALVHTHTKKLKIWQPEKNKLHTDDSHNPNEEPGKVCA